MLLFVAAVTIGIVSIDPTTGVVRPPDVLVSEDGDNPRLCACVQQSDGVTFERNVVLTISTGTGTARGRLVVELRYRS